MLYMSIYLTYTSAEHKGVKFQLRSNSPPPAWEPGSSGNPCGRMAVRLRLMGEEPARNWRWRRSLDPVTLEVIRNALPAIANEMAADLQRTSYNMMIYEVRDFCTALVDAEGELICQNVGGVSHFVADLGVIITRRR